jgi:hypothetical protein
MAQIILTAISYIWLFLTLLLLWLMWIGSIRILRGLQDTLVKATIASSEAAQKAADAAQRAVALLEKQSHAN